MHKNLTVKFAVFSIIEYLSNFMMGLFYLVKGINIIISIISVFTLKPEVFLNTIINRLLSILLHDFFCLFLRAV